jgi:hypothetical protein
MSDFRTFQNCKRSIAQPMHRVVDPAGWTTETLGPVANFACVFNDNDRAELVEAVAKYKRTGAPREAVTRQSFALSDLASTLADVRRELLDGRGIVMIRNFPIDRLDREEVAIAYLGIGSYLGETMVQNQHGHVLGHVKDLGEDYGTDGRSYNTNAEIRFHSDACDYVGLLCLQGAKKGGESRVASSVTLYNTMLESRPDLVEALTRDFYRSHNGEVSPGELPYWKQPIFSFAEGYFSAIGAGAAIEKALRLSGVPPLTAIQREAIDYYRDNVADIAADIEFCPGDIQFLNNYVTLHSRRHFEDWPQPERRRHLLRLWLRDPGGRPVTAAQREGRTGKGIQIKGLRMTAPLEPEAVV